MGGRRQRLFLIVIAVVPALVPLPAVAAKVYFVDFAFESLPDGSFNERYSLNRVNADGSGREEVVHDMGSQPQYAGLVVENGVVYWTDFDGVTLAATTGGVLLGPTPAPNRHVAAESSGRATDAAGVHTYFPQKNQFNMIDRIVGADGDYQNPVPFIATRDFEPNLAIALDEGAGKIYWAGSWGGDVAGLVQRANLSDGSAVETLLEDFTSDDFPVDLALDPAAGTMFIANSSFHSIQRANLDGSGLVSIITDTAGFAVAVDAAAVPEPMSAVAVGAAVAGWMVLRRGRKIRGCFGWTWIASA
jgi:hypothetical protein